MQPVELAAGRLRVTFTHCGDRWTHAIDVLDGPDRVVELQSLEGTPSDEWPASPALQNLHVEQRDGGPVAMLVGMAGRNHWSASVEVDAPGQRLVFDVACRTRSRPEFLGSTYGRTGRRCQLVPLDVSGRPATIDEPGPDRLRCLARVDDGEGPQTVRWQYAVTLAFD